MGYVRAKIGLTGQFDRRQPGNYLKPCILYRITRKTIRYSVYVALVFRPIWLIAVLDLKVNDTHVGRHLSKVLRKLP